MTHTVGPKGQVVIPKELRLATGLEPGDQVTFWLDGDHVAVRPVRERRALRGRFADAGLVRDLEDQRAAERARDAQR